MSEQPKLHHPWLVAVWPGMGSVAIAAGYYLMAKLGMHGLAEFSGQELFDAEHVEVRGGLIRPGRLPRSRLFVWNDPRAQRDIVVFIGEAQPPVGKHAFCRRLIEYARELGVERVFTFAAMATPMQPADHARTFGAATDESSLLELKRQKIAILEDGQIGGLNGVLLGVAAELGMSGSCLLGEMPHTFAQLPFPKASLAVLETFAAISSIEVDLHELREQARVMEAKLGELLERMQSAAREPAASEEPSYGAELDEEQGPGGEDRRRIDALFERAKADRAKAYELKRELDRLGVFREYEDRFLDLFKKPG
ncbi:MAG: PAC2 family protein [Planctomycetota bacterium]